MREEQASRVLPALHLETIRRHEAHVHKQWIQTLHEREALQARRRGEQTHLARLDINTPPSI